MAKLPEEHEVRFTSELLQAGDGRDDRLNPGELLGSFNSMSATLADLDTRRTKRFDIPGISNLRSRPRTRRS